MIRVKSQKEIQRDIDSFISRYLNKNDDKFIDKLVELLHEVEDTYTRFSRVILNYLLAKLHDEIQFPDAYKIVMEITNLQFSLTDYKAIKLGRYTVNAIRTSMSPLLKPLVKSYMKSKNYKISMSDVFGYEYVEDLIVYFRRKVYVCLSDTHTINYRTLTEDVLEYIYDERDKFIKTDKQMMLFDEYKVVDKSKYDRLMGFFEPVSSIATFISECVDCCISVENKDEDKYEFEVREYNEYLSRELIIDFFEFNDECHKHIDEIIYNPEWFRSNVMRLLDEFKNELELNFNLVINIDKGNSGFIVKSPSYQRVKNAFVTNFLLMELSDLIMKNLLSTVTIDRFTNLLEDISQQVYRYTLILEIMKGGIVNEYFCDVR